MFAKEPVAGRVKTRLAPALGAAGAARLYVAFLEDLGLVLDRWGRGRVTWFVEGDPAHPSFRGREVRGQAGGDLGDRLEAAFAWAFSEGPGPVGVIGSDSPLLEPGHLDELLGAVAGPAEAAVIPADDGGYTGLALGAPCPAAFRGIAWSTGGLLGQTLRALDAAGFRVRVLAAVPDVDEPADLRRLACRLRERPGLAPHTFRALGLGVGEMAQPSAPPAGTPRRDPTKTR